MVEKKIQTYTQKWEDSWTIIEKKLSWIKTLDINTSWIIRDSRKAIEEDCVLTESGTSLPFLLPSIELIANQ